MKVGTGYIAFGGTQTVAPTIDHFCALVENYGPAEMRKTLGPRALSGVFLECPAPDHRAVWSGRVAIEHDLTRGERHAVVAPIRVAV